MGRQHPLRPVDEIEPTRSRGGRGRSSPRLAHLDRHRSGTPDPPRAAAALALGAGVPAVACTDEDIVIACNPAAAELLGRSPGEIVGAGFAGVTEARDVFGNRVGGCQLGFNQMVAGLEPIRSFELDIRGAGGVVRRVSVSVVVVVGADLDGCSRVYLMTPVQRRRRTDELLDRMITCGGLPRDQVGYGGAAARGASSEYRLTARQKEVLRLLAEGHHAVEIGERLCLSVHTVRSHVRRILAILEVGSQLEAVTKAMTLRLI